MKVRLNNDRKKSDIVLSIGMIVKNEEKVLRRCLESLKSITERIKCEIIIADTGSTDSTIQIAKEYTDNVFHFEWINDFAAARNSTLEKARGKWFLFIDADEYFDDDTSEIVNFFNTPELYNHYKCAEVVLRSYTDKEKNFFKEAHLPRFHRIDDPNDQVKFVGKVHEGIWLRQPLGCFSTIVHHTGYCYISDQKNAEKLKRNMILMEEEYRENPGDIRMLSHLIDGCANDISKKEKYVNEILELARKNPDNFYRNTAYVHAIEYYKDYRPEYALEIYDEYFRGPKDRRNNISSSAVYMMKFKILSSLGRYEESYDAYKKYVSMYERYKSEDSTLILDDLAASPIDGLTEYEYQKNTYYMALSLNRIQKYDEALNLLEQFDVNEIDGEGYRELLGTIREICKAKKDYVTLAKYYEQVCSSESNDKLKLSLYMMESTYYSLDTIEKRKKYACDICNSGAKGKYIDLMELIISQDSSDFVEKLEKFIDSVEDWADGYTEALNLAIKYKVDMSDIVVRIKADTYRSKLQTISLSDDDFTQNVLEYGIPETYFKSIKALGWITAMYEKASYRAFNLNNDSKYELYYKFTLLLGNYINNIYNPELLNDDDIDVLPALHRFGYHMYNANTAFNNGDKLSYIRNMKKALLSCESMKEIVEFLLEEFKKKL